MDGDQDVPVVPVVPVAVVVPVVPVEKQKPQVQKLKVVEQAQVIYKDYLYIISSSGFDYVYDRIISLYDSDVVKDDEYQHAKENKDRIALYIDKWPGSFEVTELIPDASQIRYVGVTWKRSDGRIVNEAKMMEEYDARMFRH